MKVSLFCSKYILIGLLTTLVVNAQTEDLRLIVTDQNSALILVTTARLKKNSEILKEINKTNSGIIIFSGLEAGRYTLEISAEGFKGYSSEIEIKAGKNEIRITLEIAEIKEKIDVETTPQRKSLDGRDGAFSETLTKQEIEALSNNPEEMKRQLQNIAGPNATFLVNGFPEKDLPPKSEIESIKIIRSAYDAEFHEAGNTYISIITKAGGSKWRGKATLNFNDSLLNARDVFAVSHPKFQKKRLSFSLSGGVIKNKASLWLSGTLEDSDTASNIFAVLPEGRFNSTVNQKYNFMMGRGVFLYNLTKNHPLNIGFSRDKLSRENIGVGGFDLSERSYDSKSISNTFQLSTSGPIGTKFFHEFRFQTKFANSESSSINDNPTLIVLDSFTSGGAGVENNSDFTRFNIAENLGFGNEKHLFKFGLLFEYENRKLISADNQNGKFIFSSLNDFVLGRPALFTQRLESRDISLSQSQLGLYFQDTADFYKSFSVNLGLRYEWQNNLKDYNNFSPRIGFAWSPQESGKTVLRGGFGVYYDWLAPNYLATIKSNGINQPNEIIITNPTFPLTLNNQLSTTSLRNYMQLADNLVNPYIIVSSIGIFRKINKQSSIIATYKFERGLKQFRSRDLNAPNSFGVRPNSNFGKIIQIESSSFFERSSLEMSYRTNLAKTINLSLNYTLAKSVSESDYIFDLPSDNSDLRRDRSFSDDDKRHQIYSSMSWQIKRNLGLFFTFNVDSPTPYSITTGIDENGDTVFNDRPLGFKRNTERGEWQTRFDAYLNWSLAFNSFKLWGKSSSETSTQKSGANTNQRKKYSLNFSVNARNLFNQTNFTRYVGVQISPFFRQPVSAQDARKINFGVEFSF